MLETSREHEKIATDLDALLALDPALARLAALTGPLPERSIPSGYAGLAWVIIGQQISVAAARAIHARCLHALGCFCPSSIIQATDDTLKSAGLSAPKIRSLRASAEAIESGVLNLENLGSMSAEEAVAALTLIKGVGPWTAEVYLLFALAHSDVFPAGDLALQEAARIAFALDARPSAALLRQRAELWRPYRGTAARLLWAYYRHVKSGRDAIPA